MMIIDCLISSIVIESTVEMGIKGEELVEIDDALKHTDHGFDYFLVQNIQSTRLVHLMCNNGKENKKF